MKATLELAWRIVVAGVAFAAALVAARLAFAQVGWSPPRMPAQAPETVAGWYLLSGSLVLAGGLVLPALGVGGRPGIRGAVLAVFVCLGFGVSTTIEAAVYSTVEGMGRTIGLLLLPSVVLAAVAAGLFRPGSPVGTSPGKGRGRPPLEGIRDRRGLRLAAAVAAFPAIYFAFGILVAPLVSGYYREGVAGLVLPEPGTILTTELLRSALHLLAALPVIHFWGGSRRDLALALGSGFFVFVASWDFVLAYRVPLVLVVVHGLEVLAGSLVYGWALTALLVREGELDPGRPALDVRR